MNRTTQHQGFTLVELALVLAILGLLAGGVLVGQDLVKAAEINNSISTLQGYNAAANTFQAKFGALPGDLSAKRASMYGMVARSGNRGQGDGNRIIEGCGWREAALGCETALFWTDLSRSELIADAFSIGGNIADGNSVAANVSLASQLSEHVPSLIFRDSAFIHVMPSRDRNLFLIANFTTDANGDIQLSASQALSPSEAAQMDQKLDDGLPNSGLLRAISAVSATGAGTTDDTGTNPAASGECVNAALTPAAYNTANEAFKTQLNCSLRLLSAF